MTSHLVISTTVKYAAIRSSAFVIAKPCKRLWQSVFLLRGIRILSRQALRMTHRLVIANTYGVWLHFRLPVIAIDFAAFVPLVIASEQSELGNPFPHPLVIAKPCNGCGNPFLF